MASPSSIRRIVTETFKQTNKIIPLFLGPPGSAKSALAKQIGNDLGLKTYQFFVSLRQETDLLGTPSTVSGLTVWCPPEEIVEWQRKPGLVIFEEVSDAPMPMQNPICAALHDRLIGTVDTRDSYFILTGNRTEDKSGANRLSTKLGNRIQKFDFDPTVDDFVAYQLARDPEKMMMVCSYLRWKPDALVDFDASRMVNATSRSWEAVSLVPTTLAPEDYYLATAGLVGEGRAAEYCGFTRIWAELPDPTEIIARPERAPVPEKADVQYATMGMIAHNINKNNFDVFYKYLTRFPRDMTISCVNDAKQLKPEIVATPTYQRFCIDNSKVILAQL
jgi:hypothetical protein